MDRAIEIMGDLELLQMLEILLIGPFIMPLWYTKKKLPAYRTKAD